MDDLSDAALAIEVIELMVYVDWDVAPVLTADTTVESDDDALSPLPDPTLPSAAKVSASDATAPFNPPSKVFF